MFAYTVTLKLFCHLLRNKTMANDGTTVKIPNTELWSVLVNTALRREYIVPTNIRRGSKYFRKGDFQTINNYLYFCLLPQNCMEFIKGQSHTTETFPWDLSMSINEYKNSVIPLIIQYFSLQGYIDEGDDDTNNTVVLTMQKTNGDFCKMDEVNKFMILMLLWYIHMK